MPCVFILSQQAFFHKTGLWEKYTIPKTPSKLPFYGNVFPNPVIEILCYQEEATPRYSADKKCLEIAKKMKSQGIFRVSYLKYSMRLGVIILNKPYSQLLSWDSLLKPECINYYPQKKLNTWRKDSFCDFSLCDTFSLVNHTHNHLLLF